MTKQRVCIAQITGAHGVRGLVKIRCFADDSSLLTKAGPLLCEKGENRFTILEANRHKNGFLSKIEGVESKEQADKLRGQKLFIDRAALPEPDDEEFYFIDLIGLPVLLTDDTPAGMVAAVQNFGAGDLLEIQPEKGPRFFVPFTRAAVPVVDLRTLRIVIDPPELTEIDIGDIPQQG